MQKNNTEQIYLSRSLGFANELFKVINESTPYLKICVKSKVRFNEKFKKAQMRARKLKKVWKANPYKQTWGEFWAASNYKEIFIKKAFYQAYKTKIAIACTSKKSIWQFFCWFHEKIAERAPFWVIKGKIYPKLNAGKLMAKFLPLLSNASTADIDNYLYPKCMKIHFSITNTEI